MQHGNANQPMVEFETTPRDLVTAIIKRPIYVSLETSYEIIGQKHVVVYSFQLFYDSDIADPIQDFKRFYLLDRRDFVPFCY